MQVKVTKATNFAKRIEAGDKIKMIKEFRANVTVDGIPIGLKDSKDIIDGLGDGKPQMFIEAHTIVVRKSATLGLQFGGFSKIPLEVRLKQLASAALKSDETGLAEDLLAVFNKHYG